MDTGLRKATPYESLASLFVEATIGKHHLWTLDHTLLLLLHRLVAF